MNARLPAFAESPSRKPNGARSAYSSVSQGSATAGSAIRGLHNDNVPQGLVGRAPLFITRKAGGTGGMQQYTRDLVKALGYMYGKDAHVIQPMGVSGTLTFPFRVLYRSIQCSRKRIPIHLGDGALAPIALLLKKINTQSQISLTAHGLDIVFPASWYQRILNTSLQHVDRVICVSEATAAEVRKRGVVTGKIEVIPCGIWHDRYSTNYKLHTVRSPNLLSVARLVPRKGILWFIGAVLPELITHFPDLHYKIVGDGPQRNAIELLIRERSLQNNCSVLGRVTDEQRDLHLRQADLFVMPNIAVPGDMEGFGMTCIEAASRGVPVAAAKIEGVQDAVVDGETGRLFASGDAEEAAHVIQHMLQSPLQRVSIMNAARGNYDWYLLSKRYAHVFAS